MLVIFSWNRQIIVLNKPANEEIVGKMLKAAGFLINPTLINIIKNVILLKQINFSDHVSRKLENIRLICD